MYEVISEVQSFWPSVEGFDELKINKSLVQGSINRTKLWSLVVNKMQTVGSKFKI